MSNLHCLRESHLDPITLLFFVVRHVGCLSGHLLRGEHIRQVIFRQFDAAHVIAQAKLHYIERVLMDYEHPSPKLYVTLHEEHRACCMFV